MSESAPPVSNTAKAPALFTAALALLVVTIVSGVAYAFYLRPLYQKHLQIHQAVVEQSTLLTQLRLKTTQPTVFEQNLELLRKQIDDVESQLPTIDMAAEKMNRAINQARSLGVHFQSIEQEPSVSEGDYAVLPTHVVLMGSYVDVLNWLYWITNTQKSIQIEKIDLTVFSENETRSVLTAEFDFKVYARPTRNWELQGSK